MKPRTALITGSSKGIGKAIAKRFAKEGFVVFVTYHVDKKAGQQTVREIQEQGGIAHLLQLDVCSEESVVSAFEKFRKDFNFLNVLVSNAGIEIPKNIEDASFDEWRIVTETKINGSFLVTKYALPLLKLAENANLIVISSRYGEKPDPDFIAYCIGSAGLIAFTKAMALSLPKYGIRVNAISPGPTRTPMWNRLGGHNEEMWERFSKQNPMGRNPTVDDIAETAWLIVNDPTRYMNGNFIYVDGGLST
jgi:NAD(P)-dependent dehydrogenase (short-subunit alcohol dehydrogenase family)